MDRSARRSRLREAVRLKLAREERRLQPRTMRALYLCAAVLAVAGATLFIAVLADVLDGDEVALADPALAEWLNSQRSPELTVAATALALVFGPVAMPVIVLATTVLWAARARRAWRPLLLAGSMLFGLVLVQVITRLVDRPRPPMALMMLEPDGTPSFPSGHVTAAADFALVTAFLVVSRAFRLLWALLSAVLAVAVVATQALARMYLGYHWLSDCVASASLALVVLGAAVAVDTWYSAGRPRAASAAAGRDGRRPVGG